MFLIATKNASIRIFGGNIFEQYQGRNRKNNSSQQHIVTFTILPFFFLVPSILKFPNLPPKYKKKCQQVKKFVDFNQIENNESKFTFTGADYNELRTVNVITIDSL